MNYFRTFLDSFRERAASVRVYISTLVFGESSISGDEDHKPLFDFDGVDRSDEEDGEDIFYDAEDRRDDLVTETKALKGGITHYTIKAQGLTDPTSFMEFCKPNVLQLMRAETKVYIRLECTMKKTNPADNTEETVRKTFRSSNHIVYPNYINDTYDEMVVETLEEFAKYQMDGSGWSLKSTDSLLVSVVEWKPMKGSSYIPLSKNLKNKGALINIKNQDQKCFKWAVTRALNPVGKNPDRITKALIEQSEQYNWDGISFPTPTEEIARFEKNNNVSINVMANNGDERVYPLQGSKHKFDTKINLMLIMDEERDSHYVVVKNMSRLLYKQSTDRHGERHYCFNCFNGFTSEKRLLEHMLYCNDKDCVKTTLPTLGKNTLKFKNFKNTQRHPFVISADFECFTKPLDFDETANTASTANTIKYQHHEPSGFCYYVKCSENPYYTPSRVDIKLVNNKEKFLKLACKPNYQSCTIFSEDLVAVHMKRTELVLNKPIYLGMSILDISKNNYNFHYNYIKPKYATKAKLLFTDTDSLCYEIETKDFYEDISLDVHKWFDTSNYPKNHVDRDGHKSSIPTGVNKKVPGLFKDECGGKQMTEFIGLRPKLYACDVEGVGESKRAKGVKTSTVKKDITLANYRECLYSGNPQTRSMCVIRSRRHELYSERITKVALCPKDDKRIILKDKISTLAIGHYTTKN